MVKGVVVVVVRPSPYRSPLFLPKKQKKTILKGK
jgi:hypothetical protein